MLPMLHVLRMLTCAWLHHVSSVHICMNRVRMVGPIHDDRPMISWPICRSANAPTAIQHQASHMHRDSVLHNAFSSPSALQVHSAYVPERITHMLHACAAGWARCC